MSLFRDRAHAGQELARKTSHLIGREGLLVLGLPRGGVPVAFEVAKALCAPLDVYVIRKLGVPDQPELAMGAIAPGGTRVLNENVIRMLGISDATIDKIARSELEELNRRLLAYRGKAEEIDVEGQSVILVDDGLATGATMRAAVEAVKGSGARSVTVAVPLSSPDTAMDLAKEVDELICVETPEPFYGVGQWYSDFSQTTDNEVKDLLNRAGKID